MVYFGYDPGGNDRHGVAALDVQGGKPVSVTTALVGTAEMAIQWFSARAGSPVAIGVDTLTCWSTGPAGWRPADRWLRENCPQVGQSVAAPNSLYGSMSLNGMMVLLALRGMAPQVMITETHPKVMHWYLWGEAYDFVARRSVMVEALAKELGLDLALESDHEWDAALSALAAFRGSSGQWQRNLHAIAPDKDERLVMPCGVTKYFWPA
ncbi:DUF429 domain-containing protein [Accumulibacter sp.]|uniref:DUF429 domain-containing protein n=1 Tax=Accumulibacter sp. TaxID=2053492 RepID=UPI0025EF7416|nr:DUF429 domain-containing protein [Accumulibacter sp.]MCM8626960.1 DUF429 domain-containing protein [Accumulibacter sp.]